MPDFGVAREALATDAAEIARLSGELGYPVRVQVIERHLEALLADPR